jgi:phosphohistidine phosphatase
MKTVLILRHAKSSWGDPTLSDFDRPLKKRGMAEAPRLGRLLRSRDLVPDRIIASPARRARETAALVADGAGYDGEIAVDETFYPGDPEDYVAALRVLDDGCDRVMVVGHNPGLEMLVMELTDRETTLSTAALAQVTLPIDHWAELDACSDGMLVAVWVGRDLTD